MEHSINVRKVLRDVWVVISGFKSSRMSYFHSKCRKHDFYICFSIWRNKLKLLSEKKSMPDTQSYICTEPETLFLKGENTSGKEVGYNL